MAHLLGSSNCLESLARDIEDIQNTIKDVFEKVGPLRTQSWKFPDKLASELEINDLIDTYSYSKDEDFNRLAHIVLFELVIDRLLFLLQGASGFLEQIVSSGTRLPSTSRNRPKSRTVGTTMSVGLVVKKFWSKAVQISHNIQQMKHEMKSKLDQIPKMEETIVTMREDNNLMRNAISSMRGRNSRAEERKKGGISSNANFILSSSSSVSFTGESELSEQKDLTLSVEDASLSKVLRNISVQTLDTAFVPCEACSRMQQNLLDVGASVISLCESQGLPSALAKQKRLLKQSLMAAADVSRWTNEQTRDIERINRHLDNLYAQINPLKEDLDSSRAHNRKLQEQIKELQQSKQNLHAEKIESEEKLTGELQEQSLQNKANMDEMETKVIELQSESKTLQNIRQDLEKENATQRKKTEEIVNKSKELSANLEKEIAETSRLREIEREFHVLKEDLAFVRNKLYETEIELNKSQTENKAITKHDKALQSKQEALLLRADQLDQECEELQSRIQEMEEEQEKLKGDYEALKNAKNLSDEEVAKLQKSLKETSDENDYLAKSIVDLEDKIAELKEQVNESTQRLRMISQFPVLDHNNGTAKESMDDILEMLAAPNAPEEMASVIMANSARIAILEEQNSQLRNALDGYEQFQRHKSTTIPKERVQLWTSRGLNRNQVNNNNMELYFSEDSSANLTVTPSPRRSKSKQLVKDVHRSNGNETSPKPPSKPRTANSKLNEKRHAFGIGASLAHSEKPRKLRQGNITSTGHKFETHDTLSMGREPMKTTAGSKEQFDWTDTYSCPDCDKMYSNQRDLQIHKSFCYGKS
eukprot:gene14131-15608_t